MNLAAYKSDETKEQRLGDITSACKRYSLGRASLMREAQTAGAIIRIGRRIIINYTILDCYFDSLSGE